MKYKIAQVKFNNGYGALLCNRCDVIIEQGTKHQDVYHLCNACKKQDDEIWAKREAERND
jgi:hypothetical protein